MANFKMKVNASQEKVHVAGIGSVESGKWFTVSPEQKERFETLQGVKLEDAASELLEIKDPDGKNVEPVVLNPPKEEETQAEEEEKKEDS